MTKNQESCSTSKFYYKSRVFSELQFPSSDATSQQTFLEEVIKSPEQIPNPIQYWDSFAG